MAYLRFRDRFGDSKSLQLSLEDTVIASYSFRTPSVSSFKHVNHNRSVIDNLSIVCVGGGGGRGRSKMFYGPNYAISFSSIYLQIPSRSFSDHHLGCGGLLLNVAKGKKYSE